MGGSQLDLFNAARHETEAFDVEVIVGTDGPLRDACDTAGIPARLIRMTNSLIVPVSDVVALARLVRHLHITRPDIVRTHASKAGILGRVAARLAGVPVVMHTVVIPPFHDQQSLVARRLIILLERLCSRFTDQYVSVSAELAGEFVRRGICRRDRIAVIPSGIDLESFPQRARDHRERLLRSLGVDPEARVLISVAELDPRKGHELAIDALERLVRAGHHAVLLIVGPGSQYAELHREIAARGLTGRAVLTGPRQDVPDLLSAADVFIQSSWREGVSRSLAEAMYAGLPPVATDVGGTRELVVDGHNGFLIPAGNVEALTSRLQALLTDQSLRFAMGSRAREAVRSERSVASMNARLDGLYRRLLDSAAGRSHLGTTASSAEDVRRHAV